MAKKIIGKMLELLIRAAITISATVPFETVLTDAAFRERGYSAIGGEWILIIAIAAALWKLSGYIVSPESEQKRKARELYLEDCDERTQAQHKRRGSSTVCDNCKLELDEMGSAESVLRRDRQP